MHKRAVRITLVALLLASGTAASVVAWNTERRVQSLEAERRGVEVRLARIAAAAMGIAAAQQAYIDYGQRDDASFARVAALLDQITTDAAGLDSRDSAPDGAPQLDAFWAALAALSKAHADARETLAGGEALLAADLLFAAARPHVDTIDASLRAFRDAELNGYSAERAGLTQQAWLMVGGVALLWLFGLLALARVPAPQAEPPTAALPEQPSAPREQILIAPEPAPAHAGIDLEGTAAVCAELAALTDTEPLPRILSRAAEIVDARGLIVWMGAGDELFAATAAGYDPALVSRLRPISRTAENATAAAWRTREVRTVAGDGINLGAIVAPMPSAGGCIGVLAAEVRNGREHDPAARAATALIASQLAAVVSAWPAASSPSPGAEAHDGTISDRQAAAS